MGEDLRRESEEVGLSINWKKTKVMSNIQTLGEIEISSQKIEKVTEFKYLGQTVSFENRSEKETKIRRANAWKAFWGQKIFWNGKLSLKAKIKIFESNVIPVLTYGAQTWAHTKKQTEKLMTTQNSMLRNILKIKIKDKVRISKILEKTKAKGVGVTIKKTQTQICWTPSQGVLIQMEQNSNDVDALGQT